MPIYVFVCSRGHRTEVLRPMGYAEHRCDCGRLAVKRPARFAQLNPETGAMLRNKYSLFAEASQEIDHAYVKHENDTGKPIEAPMLWLEAKERALAQIAAGEAPPLTPLS